MKASYIVMHIGGSVVVPHISDTGGINVTYLKKLRTFLLPQLKKGRKFIIVIGGGKTARAYQKSAARVVDIHEHDLDWIGIHATRLNAHLLRTIFEKEAYPVIIDHDPSPEEVEMLKSSNKNLFFASGWKPGWSTDYIAVELARKFGSKEIIIAKDTPYVYDSDPKKNRKAKPIKSISWKEYAKLIPSLWAPGLSAPVDPIATRLASRLGLQAKIVKGTDLKNMKKAIEREEFVGTLIF